jgi:hypothetical protein
VNILSTCFATEVSGKKNKIIKNSTNVSGAWLQCLEFLAWMCVTMNCLLLCVSTSNVDWLVVSVSDVFGFSNLFVCPVSAQKSPVGGDSQQPETGWIAVNVLVRLLVAFVLEHFIFIVRYAVDGVLGRMPKWVWAEINLSELDAKKSLKGLVDNTNDDEEEPPPIRFV